MNYKFLISLLLLFPLTTQSQNSTPSVSEAVGGKFEVELGSCLSPEKRTEIQQTLAQSIEQLERAGAFSQLRAKSQIVSFDWPLRQAAGFTDPSYYGISNYVDQNTSSGNILDYNCNSRTYDGHRGLDIFTWPFGWKKMAENAVEIVAAAPGVIISKIDGYEDKHCACVNYDWNAVYVRHADNSIAWYGHMKTGSTTTKAVGQTVAQGEYLGVVGSSGCSTGPHLHFEVYDGSNNLIDPYSGTCNAFNTSTWWANQKPWSEPTLNKLMLGTAPASTIDCPTNQDTPNESSAFTFGSRLYVTSFFHDQTVGNVTNYTIYYPNNTAFASWSHSSPSTYTASWWYWYFTLPSNNPGTWRVVATFNSQTVEKTFTLNAVVPVELIDLQATLTKNKTVELRWQTATEINGDFFDIQKSTDGLKFQSIGKVKMKGHSVEKQAYNFHDTEGEIQATTYYRLRQIDVDGKESLSKTVSVTPTEMKLKFTFYPSPTGEKLNINYQTDENMTLELFDCRGQSVKMSRLSANQTTQSLDVADLPTGVYIAKINSNDQSFTQKIVKQ